MDILILRMKWLTAVRQGNATNIPEHGLGLFPANYWSTHRSAWVHR